MEIEYVDVLFLHCCDEQEDYDGLMKPGGLLDIALRFQKEGKARFIGFSGHNTSTSRQAAENGKIDVVMFPINFTSHAVPGRRELFETCAAHRVGLVSMKPFAGGNLLKAGRSVEVDDFVMGRTETAGASMKFSKSAAITPVQCLAYILDQTGVSTAVPGCANLEQIDAALAYHTATAEDKNYAAVLSDFEKYQTGICVHCNHCLPCPSNIDIGETLRLLQMAQQGKKAKAKTAYAKLSASASECIQCGSCMDRCPFGVDVISRMEEAVGFFA